MSNEMTEVDPAERAAAERQAAYAKHQQLVSATNALNAAGMTIEQMRQAVAAADEQRASASAYARQRAIERDLEQRQQAAERADKERAEAEARAATFKAQKLADWLAGGLGTESEFNRQFDAIRLAIFAQGGTANDEAAAMERDRAEKRRRYST
jgi:DNA-binding transcriptional MerR regulator